MPCAPHLSSVPGIRSGPMPQGRSLKGSGIPDGSHRPKAATADPQHDPGAARPAPLDAFPYPPGSRARHRLDPRRAVRHDRQLRDEQIDPARHAEPEHGAGRLHRHPLPRRRGDRGAGVRAMSDTLGRRKLFTWTLAVYLVGTALTALTPKGSGWDVPDIREHARLQRLAIRRGD